VNRKSIDAGPRPTQIGARSRLYASVLLRKALAFAAGAVLLAAGLMFSLLVFAFVAAGALMLWGFLWWKTRELRRQLRAGPPGGRVIDGAAVRDTDTTSP